MSCGELFCRGLNFLDFFCIIFERLMQVHECRLSYSAAFIKCQNKMQYFAIEMHLHSQRFAIIWKYNNLRFIRKVLQFILAFCKSGTVCS